MSLPRHTAAGEVFDISVGNVVCEWDQTRPFFETWKWREDRSPTAVSTGCWLVWKWEVGETLASLALPIIVHSDWLLKCANFARRSSCRRCEEQKSWIREKACDMHRIGAPCELVNYTESTFLRRVKGTFGNVFTWVLGNRCEWDAITDSLCDLPHWDNFCASLQNSPGEMLSWIQWFKQLLSKNKLSGTGRVWHRSCRDLGWKGATQLWSWETFQNLGSACAPRTVKPASFQTQFFSGRTCPAILKCSAVVLRKDCTEDPVRCGARAREIIVTPENWIFAEEIVRR